MFVQVILPLADMRAFTPEDTGKIPVPNWLATPTSTTFLRGFGPLQLRSLGGSADWPAEDSFARCRGALRFGGPLGKVADLPGRPAYALRRCFFDGRSVGRVEVGLVLAPDGAEHEAGQVLKSVAALPMRVPGKPDAEVRPLIETGAELATHLLESTTLRGQRPTAPAPWWVKAGRPLALVEHWPEELARGPSMLAIDVGRGLLAQPFVYRRFGHDLRAWMISADESADPAQMRNLRIGLIRYHVERECLGLTLQRIENNDIRVVARSAPTDELQQFLAQRLKLLRREALYGVDLSPFKQFALTHGDLVEDQSGATVIERLQSARRSVIRAVKDQLDDERAKPRIPTVIIEEMRVERRVINIGRGATITAPVTIADTIENSFNRIESSAVQPELKEALEALHQEFARLAEHLPQDEAQLAARDLDDLTQEATSPQPRKAFWQRAGNGLLTAAKRTSAVGLPVIALVEKVMSVLA